MKNLMNEIVLCLILGSSNFASGWFWEFGFKWNKIDYELVIVETG